MGKPRLIILVRHAQSEGNKDRDIHQYIPDHRVKLTAQGLHQAEEAGRQLRALLKPDDTIQFFTSPYRRTRETTEGILRTLTCDDPTPSPFARHTIKVFEEPRLREQDFGNFQPCAAEMERMWQERADYGHFFYRIPNGESAADAYDRVSGFNESLWRQFGDDDFPSVCVLVTHGLMTRVFLMKWYHWSVEYFEDLRNVNHCEFIVMKQSTDNKRYILQNELRTWSELKRRAAAEKEKAGGASSASSSPSKGLPAPGPGQLTASPTIPIRRWGGCVNGCNHDKMHWPRRVMRKDTADFLGSALPSTADPSTILEGEKDDHPIASQEADHTGAAAEPSPPKITRKPSTKTAPIPALVEAPASPNDASADSSTSDDEDPTSGFDETAIPFSHPHPQPGMTTNPRHLHPGSRTTRMGSVGTQTEGFSDDSDYFPGMQHAHAHAQAHSHSQSHSHSHAYSHSSHSSLSKLSNNSAFNSSAYGKSKAQARASSKHRMESKDRKSKRKSSTQSWMHESGMGTGARADTLGDGDEDSCPTPHEQTRTASPTPMDGDGDDEEETPILREALRGNMVVGAGGVEDVNKDDWEIMKLRDNGEKVDGAYIDNMKEEDRKGFSEVL